MKKPTINDFINNTSSKDAGEQVLPEMARLNTNLPAEIHIALKTRAAQERTTINQLIIDWVRTWHKV